MENKLTGFLDSPTDNQLVCGPLWVEGWVADSPGVEFEVDGNIAILKTTYKSRPDVEASYPGRTVKGFHAALDTSSLSDGEHTIAFRTPMGSSSLRRFRVGNTRRARFAAEFLKGSGIEIGALHYPMALPAHCRVKYVDRLPVERLREHYPELSDKPLEPVDVVDDGETLATFREASQDFIVANHFLEHTQSPLRTIERHMQVLKAGGILFMAVPDKRETFDVDRPLTPLEHVYRDYHEGPQWSYSGHVREWVEIVGKMSGEKAEAEIRRITDTGYSIHFHVWTMSSLLELLVDARRSLSLSYDVEGTLANGYESLVALRRQS